MSTDTKNPSRVAAGLRSTLARDNVSNEAKMHAEERLKEMGYGDELAAREEERAHDEEMHQVHVQAGYKAALKNPKVSAEAKQNAREHLKEGEVF